jgi:hypothetical protein
MLENGILHNIHFSVRNRALHRVYRFCSVFLSIHHVNSKLAVHLRFQRYLFIHPFLGLYASSVDSRCSPKPAGPGSFPLNQTIESTNGARSRVFAEE